MSLRPTITADGTHVRLPLADRAAPLIDALATAYAADPDTVGRLLAAHADRVQRLDHAVCVDPDASDVQRAMRAAEADGSRTALVDDLDAPHLDLLLGPRDAVRLADDLTARAAYITTREKASK